MQLTLTKPQLKALQEHRGHLDTDSGKVFVGVAGSRLPGALDDGLWHLTASFREPEPSESLERFSLSETIEADTEPDS